MKTFKELRTEDKQDNATIKKLMSKLDSLQKKLSAKTKKQIQSGIRDKSISGLVDDMEQIQDDLFPLLQSKFKGKA